MNGEMTEHLSALVAGIRRWQSRAIGDHWFNISYMGPAVNRFGDHDFAVIDQTLWHYWDGAWRRIDTGSDFWLFSVPGAFAWTRDIVTKVLPATGADPESLELAFNEEYGYVEFLRLRVGKRAPENFTFEVRRFELGTHPEFEGS